MARFKASGNGGKKVWVLIDKEDHIRIGKHKWYVRPNGYVFRRVTVAKRKRKVIWLHWEILRGVPIKGMDLDHKNRNPLDNRKVNLRICSRSLNARNSKDRKNNFSRGVTISGRTGKKFKVYTRVNGKTFSLGGFDTQKEAASAYFMISKLIQHILG